MCWWGMGRCVWRIVCRGRREEFLVSKHVVLWGMVPDKVIIMR